MSLAHRLASLVILVLPACLTRAFVAWVNEVHKQSALGFDGAQGHLVGPPERLSPGHPSPGPPAAETGERPRTPARPT